MKVFVLLWLKRRQVKLRVLFFYIIIYESTFLTYSLSEAWPAPFLDNTESKFGLYACGDGVHFSGDLFIISINCGSVRRFYFGRF